MVGYPVFPKILNLLDAGLLSRVADSSGLIIRKSTLKGRWWQNKDSGSFISFKRDGSAVVFSSKMEDTMDGIQLMEKFLCLRKKCSMNFLKGNYFCKQLPNRPLTFFDLLFFEIQSIRSEIAIVLLLAVIASV